MLVSKPAVQNSERIEEVQWKTCVDLTQKLHLFQDGYKYKFMMP